MVRIKLVGQQEVIDPNSGKVVELNLLYNTVYYCNAFETTDKGLVYIDVVGVRESERFFYPDNLDKIVEIKVGEEYKPAALFSDQIVGTSNDF